MLEPTDHQTRPDNLDDQRIELGRWREAFGDRLYALGSLHYGPDDEFCHRRMLATTEAAGVPLLASNEVLYHVEGRRYLYDIVTAIRLGPIPFG